jgi:anti-anti-sigma factor
MSSAPTQAAFTLEIEDSGSTAVVRCHGRLVSGVTELLYVPVSQLLPTHQRIILDLSDLTHMDSMGLGALVRLYVSSRTRGCSLELRHIGKKVRELLIMTNLLPAFTIVGEHDIRM